MWDDGLYLGIKGSAGEIVVANEKGVWTTRTVCHRPKERMCFKENADMVVGVPWRNSDGDPKDDVEVMECKTIDRTVAKP